MDDLQKAFDDGFAAVKGYVDRTFASFEGRIEAMEKRLGGFAVPVDGKDGAAGLNGKDGRDGVDGKDGLVGIAGKDGAPGGKGEPGPAGEPGKSGLDGKDGVGLAGAMIDREGALIITLSNGMHLNLGVVVGKGADGAPGKDGAAGLDGKNGADGLNGKDGAAGADGRSLTTDDLQPVIARLVDQAVKALPLPKDGRDGTHGKDGANGKSVTVDDVRPLVVSLVDEVAKAMPTPKDGKDGLPGQNGRDGTDGISGKDGAAGLDGKHGAAGQDGKDGAHGADGVGLADAMIDRDGNLVLSMTDGRTKSLGAVVGKDVDPSRVEQLVAEKVAALPIAKDGKDGRDGLGFDDMDITLGDDERTLTIAATRGEARKEWALPLHHVLDRGVWTEGKYLKGDGVTFAGSFWIAQEDTFEKPETGKGWRLAVKRGRDGKEAVRLT